MTEPITYLVNQYPSVSHTFIRREIHALERLGMTVHRIALRGWDLPLVDTLDIAERGRTAYVLKGGAASLLGPVTRASLKSPRRFLSAARLAWQMARKSDRPWPVHMAYLVEACWIHAWMQRTGTRHLHAHFATNPAEVAMLTSALGGISYSFTAHGSDIMDRPAQMGLDRTVGQASFVAAVCAFGRSQIFKWVPHTSWRKVQVVRCGLESGYGDAAPPAQAGVRRLVCIGRLSKEKGQLLLIEAASQLASQGVSFELVLAGDGPMRGDVEALARQHGITDRIRITGWLDAQGIEAELRAARALIVPSLSEGLPVVIMEAMANRRPVVAPYLAGIPELVAHERSGWLYPAGDVDALAQAMRSCLDATPETLAAMSQTAHTAVWSAHHSDTEATKLAELFRQAQA